MMLRRAAVLAAGVAMATSLGLAGAGMAAAATPALRIHNGATWTIELSGGGCEHDNFNTSTHKFASPEIQYGGDKGDWSGGGSAISMVWTHGGDDGLTFHGKFVLGSSPKFFSGHFGGTATGFTGYLVKGAVPGC